MFGKLQIWFSINSPKQTSKTFTLVPMWMVRFVIDKQLDNITIQAYVPSHKYNPLFKSILGSRCKRR